MVPDEEGSRQARHAVERTAGGQLGWLVIVHDGRDLVQREELEDEEPAGQGVHRWRPRGRGHGDGHTRRDGLIAVRAGVAVEGGGGDPRCDDGREVGDDPRAGAMAERHLAEDMRATLEAMRPRLIDLDRTRATRPRRPLLDDGVLETRGRGRRGVDRNHDGGRG